MQSIKSVIRQAINFCGFDIQKLPRQDSEVYSPYGKIMLNGRYSPWNTDSSFCEYHNIIKAFTLVDKYRCYELWKLVEQSGKLKHGSVIEIGVWRGGTGALIAKQARNCDISDVVYLCDTFTGVVKAGPQDSDYKGGEHSDTTRDIVEKLIHDQLNLDKVIVLEGIFPDETGHEIENVRFRFCHIDVDVYRSAKDIIDWIWDRMVPGGIIVYDDYGFEGCDGITKYVNEQMPMNDRFVFYNLNGHAIIIKL
jgi:O-methyltransferase